LEECNCGSVEQGDAIEVFAGLDEVGSHPASRRSAGDDGDGGHGRDVEGGAHSRGKVVEAVSLVEGFGGGFVAFGDGVEGVVCADDDGHPAGRYDAEGLGSGGWGRGEGVGGKGRREGGGGKRGGKFHSKGGGERGRRGGEGGGEGLCQRKGDAANHQQDGDDGNDESTTHLAQGFHG